MSTEIKIFNNLQFGKIRTALINGEPYFVARDVANALGYARPENAIYQHVDIDDSLKQGVIDSIGREQQTAFINESGVYSLIFGSKLAAAKQFKSWVTSEVLPSIRKHGAYMTDITLDKVLQDPSFLIGILTELQSERESKRIVEAEKQYFQEVTKSQEILIQKMRPKELFADAVTGSKHSCSIGELAKILKQNGVNDMGQNRLFKYLRNTGYLCSRGLAYNQPTQLAMEKKLFEIRKSTFITPVGEIKSVTTTLATGVGQQYFVSSFLGTSSMAMILV